MLLLVLLCSQSSEFHNVDELCMITTIPQELIVHMLRCFLSVRPTTHRFSSHCITRFPLSSHWLFPLDPRTTHCPPCRAIIALLISLAADYSSANLRSFRVHTESLGRSAHTWWRWLSAVPRRRGWISLTWNRWSTIRPWSSVRRKGWSSRCSSTVSCLSIYHQSQTPTKPRYSYKGLAFGPASLAFGSVVDRTLVSRHLAYLLPVFVLLVFAHPWGSWQIVYQAYQVSCLLNPDPPVEQSIAL